jgi:hypothetical protein
MVRIVVRCLAGLLLAAALAYPVDWLVWRVRVAFGSGVDRVTVSQVTVATLKGNKSEYYVDGSTEVECSQSLFPQAGAGACWWLRGHSQLVTQD